MSPRYLSTLVGSVLLALVGPAASPAQSRSAASPERPNFGTSDRILYNVGRSEFSPTNSSVTYADDLVGRYSTVMNGIFIAAPHIPSGAFLTYLELDYCDDSPGLDVAMRLEECTFYGLCSDIETIISSTGLPGCSLVSVDLTPHAYTMDNNARRLVLLAQTSSGTPTNRLLGAYIGYKLQVSPAPASATFLDVPTGHPFFRFVEALADAGITGGCGGNNFCPDAPLTRGQMAVFLSVALGLHFPN